MCIFPWRQVALLGGLLFRVMQKKKNRGDGHTLY